jgi:hypothetical protein
MTQAGQPTIFNMVFCTYCGKSFTRKEHLERHIPSHTNVKPHKCTVCQLSFGRRDLLQRHFSTYHEVRDPSLQDAPPTMAGRTPIACINCANAKTGCDKKVPCSRCADKSLPCAARFARRSQKLLARSVSAYAELQTQAKPENEEMMDKSMTIDPSVVSRPASVDNNIDPQLPTHPEIDNTFSPNTYFTNDQTTLSPSKVDCLDQFFQFTGVQFDESLVSPPLNYPEMMTWNDYSMEIDSYSGMVAIPPGQFPPLPALSDHSECSSRSDTSPSSRCSSRSSLADIHNMDEMHLKTVELPESSQHTDFEAVLAAETAWPLARCNPPTFSGSCPRTAVIHLESLERNSKHDDAWQFLEASGNSSLHSQTPEISIEPIMPGTRDKLLAITQSFLHRALETHRTGINNSTHSSGYPNSPGNFSFLVLPPSNVLEFFLRSYSRSLSTYFSLVSDAKIDPNDLMQNNQACTLQVLLMIAQGASSIPAVEARNLSAGLTETCRISLFDIIERDIELCADPVVLRCALLFTLLGATKQMDIIMGQRGMYLAVRVFLRDSSYVEDADNSQMLKHSGMLEPQPLTLPSLRDPTSFEAQWRHWQSIEGKNR